MVKSSTIHHITAAYCLLVSTFTLAETKTIDSSFTKWSKNCLKIVGTSWLYKQLEIDGQTYQSLKDATDLEKPYSISSEVSRSDQRPFQPEKDTVKANTYSIENSLTSNFRNSLSASLSLSSSYSEVDVPVIDDVIKSKQHTTNATISYDVIKGSKKTPQNIQSEIDSLNYRKTLADLAMRKIGYKINDFNAVLNLFNSHCQLETIKRYAVIVEKIVNLAEIRKKAQTLPYKDFLSFEDLILSVRSRESSSIYQLQAARNAFALYGNDMFEQILKEEEKIECPSEIGAVPKDSSDSLNLGEAFKRLPSYKKSLLDLKIAELQLKLVTQTEKPSLRPFVSGEYTYAPDNQANNEQGKIRLGASVSWTLPVKKTLLELSSAKSTVLSSQIQINLTAAKELTNLTDLQRRTAQYLSQLDTSGRSLETSRKIIKILQTQFEAGIVDSVVYNNAQTKSIDLELSQINAWSEYTRALYETNVYREAINN